MLENEEEYKERIKTSVFILEGMTRLKSRSDLKASHMLIILASVG